MNAEIVIVQVVHGEADDAEEISSLTATLRSLLLELDVKAVDSVPVEAPSSAKGLGTVLGALMVSIGAAERLARVAKTIAAWARRNDRTVEIRLGNDMLKVTNASSEQQNQLIDAWLARHGSSD